MSEWLALSTLLSNAHVYADFRVLLLWTRYELSQCLVLLSTDETTGYGHATRVSAVASYLCSQQKGAETPVVIIVSSAPKKVFQEAIDSGARYRSADIDPVIVQPLASVLLS